MLTIVVAEMGSLLPEMESGVDVLPQIVAWMS